MRIVADELEVIETEISDFALVAVDEHARRLPRLPRKLKFSLFHVVGVEMEVAEGVHELLGSEFADFGDHHGEKGIGGHVEGHAKEDVCAALVELATEGAVGDVELKQGVAGGQGHEMQFAGVPGADEMPPAIRVFSNGTNDFVDLIDRAAVRFSPVGPLSSVNAAEVAVFIGPLVPNGHLVFVEVLDVGIALQEPEQLVNDGTQVKFLGGQEGELVLERVSYLGSEHGISARAGTVVPVSSFVEEVL